MKKGFIVLLIIVVLLMILFGWGVKKFNLMQQTNIEVKNSWAEVENQLNRRYDLIPNLVETVKGYAKHEKDVLVQVTEMRSRVGSAQSLPEKMDANNALSGALSRLMVVVERYPDLKANTNFIRLQDELTGTENRLAVSRKRYNDTVTIYNKMIVTFPNFLFAGAFNLKPAEFFKSPVAASEAPKVKF